MAFLDKASKDRTVHSSFRINEDILSTIEKEAASKGISKSSLVNQILTRYCKTDKYFDQLGFIPISKVVVRKWLTRIDDKFLVEDAKDLGSTMGREYISYFFHDVNRYTLLEFLELWFSRFSTYDHKVNSDTHSFAVNHDINIKYSLSLKEFLKALVEPIILKQVKFMELTPNLLSFSFEV